MPAIPRKIFPAGLAAAYPSIFLVTLAKSATVYISHTLSNSLGYDHCNNVVTPSFPQNTITPDMLKDFVRGGMLSVSHLAAEPHNLNMLKEMGVTKGVLHLRDPRAALVSWFHFLPRNPRVKAILDGLTKEEQIEWVIKEHYDNFVNWTLGWMTFLDTATPGQWDYLVVTHDELLADEDRYFQRILDFYGLKATIRNVKRNSSTHFRKGDNDDWRSLFNEEQTKRLNAKLPPELMERFGWSY